MDTDRSHLNDHFIQPQHKYYAEIQSCIECAQSAVVIRRKHIPTWLYKQSHRLTDEMEHIRTELEQIGTLIAKRQREKS